MKFIVSTGLILLLSLTAFTQENKKVSAKNSNIQFYGFIRNEFYYDSYKGLNAAMDNFYLFPLYQGTDPEGKDINRQGMANYTAMATRFGMNIKGIEVLGAETSANIETDFAGIVNEYPEVLRLRKAYLLMDWGKVTLLAGQTWHPFWNGSGAFFPHVAGLNTGAPFNPFNRSPQLDIDYNIGKITLSFTALYEHMYCSKGFYTVTNSNNKNLVKRNAAIPEMVAGVYYNNSTFSLGIAGQFNAIKPIAITDMGYVTNELNTSFSGMGYLGYKTDKLFMLLKGTIGQNMVNMTMLGGYGVKDYDTTTGKMKYTNYTNYTSLFNIVYGKKVQLGFLGGFAGNLGTADVLYNFDGSAKTVGLFPNIKALCRAAPSLSFYVKSLKLSAEYEMTMAKYGTGNFDFADGLYGSHVTATNHRVLMVMMYNF